MKYNNINNLPESTFAEKIIIAVVIIIWILFIIKYLKELEICNCTSEVAKNIKTLIYVEYIFIVCGIIEILILFYLKMFVKQSGGGISVFDIYMVFSIIIYLLLIYNAVKIFNKIDKKCECSMSSLRYLLYIQFGFIILTFLFIILQYGKMKYIIKRFYK